MCAECDKLKGTTKTEGKQDGMNPAERPTTRRPKRDETDAWPPEKVARLVPTKLPPAFLRAYVIPQQRLLDKLREAPYSHRLTLVFGPAGYGKTTLLATLLHAEGTPG